MASFVNGILQAMFSNYTLNFPSHHRNGVEINHFIERISITFFALWRKHCFNVEETVYFQVPFTTCYQNI